MIKAINNLKKNTFLQFFTVYMRFLIGGVFIIAAFSMGKFSDHAPMNGDSFPIEESTPGMILFFKVIIESGLFWKFIGWTQVIAGVLLMTQRYAKLGAAIFFGLILNIFVITISYDFTGTPIITGLMLLATIYLLIWDAESFQFLFLKEGVLKDQNLVVADNIFWIWLGFIMLTSIISLALLKVKIFTILFIALIEGFIGLLFFLFKKSNNPDLNF